MTDWGEHYKRLFERAERDRDWYKAHLFDAWKTMRGQTKGLQRQRRLIVRLQKQLADKSVPRPEWVNKSTEVISDRESEHD